MVGKTKPEYDKRKLAEWRDSIGHEVANYIMINAGKIGREAHTLNENYIRMDVKDTRCSLLAYAHHTKLIPYLDKMSVIYGIEAKLHSIDMMLAGTADCICDYDGLLSIVDYKTKRSTQRKEWINDYFIQTATYAKMWESITHRPIVQLVVLVSSETNTTQEFLSQPSKHYDEMNNRLKIFNN